MSHAIKPFHARARLFALLSGGLAVVVGMLALVGWAYDILTLTRVHPGFAPMKPNTAVCFVLSGVSLALHTRAADGGRRSCPLGSALGVAVALWGVLTLSQDLFGWDLGIDSVLFRERVLREEVRGRMSAATSLEFSLFGTALSLLARCEKRIRLCQTLAIISGFVALVAIVGYIYGTSPLYSFMPYRSVALHTALTAWSLSAGVLCVHPGHGYFTDVLSDSASGRTFRALLGATVLIPVLIGWFEATLLRRGGDVHIVTALSTVATVVVFSAFIFKIGMALRRAERKSESQTALLREAEERLRIAGDAGRVGFWFWDFSHNHLEWTQRCNEIFGLPPGDPVTYQMFLEALHPDDREQVEGAIRRSIREDAAYDVEYRAVWPDGSVHWIAARGQPYRDATGVPVRMMGAAIDISERKRVEGDRERVLAGERAARSELERAARQKDEFLAILSHELRTPLTSVLGWAQILHDKPLTVPSRKPIEVILRNTKGLVQLVSDMLDMSSIVTGKLRLEMRLVDPREVILAAVETMRTVVEAKGIRLAVHWDGEVGAVRCDPSRLQQIVWNLLSNAVKFTPRGGSVDVSVRGAGSSIEIRVADTGAGIVGEFLPHVFDRFRQEDASSTRKYGGLGLGLSIVKELVELHGGSVRAESAGSGAGATFTVTLPVARGMAPRMWVSSPSDTPALLAGLRILVVDDDRDSLELVRQILEMNGATVTAVGSGGEALAAAQPSRPDVLVSDLGMPEMDGYELLRRIHSIKGTNDLPSVALTAFVRAEDQDRALAEGFGAHIPKPIDPPHLVAAIAMLAARALA